MLLVVLLMVWVAEAMGKGVVRPGDDVRAKGLSVLTKVNQHHSMIAGSSGARLMDIGMPLYGIAGVMFSGSNCPYAGASDSSSQIGYFECSTVGLAACALNQGYVFLPGQMPQMFYLTCEAPSSSAAGTTLNIKTWSDNTCTQPLGVFNSDSNLVAHNTECMTPVTVLGAVGNSLRVVSGKVQASAGFRPRLPTVPVFAAMTSRVFADNTDCSTGFTGIMSCAIDRSCANNQGRYPLAGGWSTEYQEFYMLCDKACGSSSQNVTIWTYADSNCTIPLKIFENDQPNSGTFYPNQCIAMNLVGGAQNPQTGLDFYCDIGAAFTLTSAPLYSVLFLFAFVTLAAHIG